MRRLLAIAIIALIVLSFVAVYYYRSHPSRRLAPPGVYFTLQYLSVPSPSGVTGLSGGTRVVCVKDEGAVLLVKAGTLEFEAQRQFLTNDLDVADLAARSDAEAQQAVASYISQQQGIYQAKQKEENAAFDKSQQEVAAHRAAAAKASAYSNPLERGTYGKTTITNLAVPTASPTP